MITDIIHRQTTIHSTNDNIFVEKTNHKDVTNDASTTVGQRNRNIGVSVGLIIALI